MAPSDMTTVLLVDDVGIVRRALRILFESAGGFRVVGEASSGREAVRMAKALKPRLITMDLDMPGGDGLQAVEDIMAQAPTRILIVTGAPRFDGRDSSYEGLSRGALDVVEKPAVWPISGPEQKKFLSLARRIASVPVILHVGGLQSRRRSSGRANAAEELLPEMRGKPTLIAIGASTGGPRILQAMLGQLPDDFSVPIVIVQHLAEAFAGSFLQWLGESTRLQVSEALTGVCIEPGTIYVALRGKHIGVASSGRIVETTCTTKVGHAPSVDGLFSSVAKNHRAKAMAVLLTGMGRDGAEGMKLMRDAGALTIAQDEESCIVFGMPKAAIALRAAERVLSPDDTVAAMLHAAGQPADV